MSRRSSSKKRKGGDDGTPSVTVCPEKTKSLEYNKRKHQSTEGVSYVELQVAISLVGLSRKKTKKAVKKVAAAEVRCVPAAFDDDFPTELTQKGFSSWPFLRFYFRDQRTPSSENEFVDIDSFQMLLTKLLQRLRHLLLLLRLLFLSPSIIKKRHRPNSRGNLS
jgi:hypothetical protein